MTLRELQEEKKALEGQGRRVILLEDGIKGEKVKVSTFGGEVAVEWDQESPMTPMGQLVFFIEFLKEANLWEEWVKDCPLEYQSPNAPKKEDVLGTGMLSILSGHWRFAHINGIRWDEVNPGLLGMQKVLSEDSVRRAFLKVESKVFEIWQREHLKRTYLPLLTEPWILDIDVTVKPLYGKQEGAVLGYNPEKPGRPSHTYHSYFIGGIRLGIDVEVQPGNHTAGSYSAPALWEFWEELPMDCRPKIIRGDCAYGNETIMVECEKRNQPHLFRLRMTKQVKKLVQFVSNQGEWKAVGSGMEAVEGHLQLQGWSCSRRVIITRKKKNSSSPTPSLSSDPFQLPLPFEIILPQSEVYEYRVLVTSLEDELLTVVQLYQDRADCENIFDELKNQWGWGGFVTQDLKRTQIWARIILQIYNWWSMFSRMIHPNKHSEAITSRPQVIESIGWQTSHSGKKIIHLYSSHAKRDTIQQALIKISTFFKKLKSIAEQLTQTQKWRIILSHIFRNFLKGKLLCPVPEPILCCFS